MKIIYRCLLFNFNNFFIFTASNNSIKTSIQNMRLYFLNNDEINKVKFIFDNKYILKKIIKEYIPIILLSFIYLNIYIIIILSIIQIILCKDLYNFMTCLLFIGYFLSEKQIILHTFSIYLLLMYLIELFCVLKYINIYTEILQLIGIFFSIFIIINIYNEQKHFQWKNIFIINSFLIFTTFFHPFSIKNRQKNIIKNKKLNIDKQDFYRYM
jgi:hypothetical protein